MTRIIALLLTGLILAGCFGGEAKDVYQKISPNDAAIMLNEDPGIMLVDVRTPEEYRSGYIKGAINIPLDDFDKQVKKMLPDKEQTIMLYCKSGKRSAVAAQELMDLGYTHILDIDGGVNAWKGILVKPEK